jgi:hypothetical protein
LGLDVVLGDEVTIDKGLLSSRVDKGLDVEWAVGNGQCNRNQKADARGRINGRGDKNIAQNPFLMGL